MKGHARSPRIDAASQRRPDFVLEHGLPTWHAGIQYDRPTVMPTLVAIGRPASRRRGVSCVFFWQRCLGFCRASVGVDHVDTFQRAAVDQFLVAQGILAPRGLGVLDDRARCGLADVQTGVTLEMCAGGVGPGCSRSAGASGTTRRRAIMASSGCASGGVHPLGAGRLASDEYSLAPHWPDGVFAEHCGASGARQTAQLFGRCASRPRSQLRGTHLPCPPYPICGIEWGGFRCRQFLGLGRLTYPLHGEASNQPRIAASSPAQNVNSSQISCVGWRGNPWAIGIS